MARLEHAPLETRRRPSPSSLILVVRNELSCTMRTSPTAKYATASVAAPPPSSIKLHHPRSLPPHLLYFATRSTRAIRLSCFLLRPHVFQCRPWFVQHLLPTQPRPQVLLSRYIHNLSQQIGGILLAGHMPGFQVSC